MLLKELIKEITERCFNNLCENFKKLFSKREKGDWFNKNTKTEKLKRRASQQSLQVFPRGRSTPTPSACVVFEYCFLLYWVIRFPLPIQKEWLYPQILEHI